MKHQWILVANASLARIFRRDFPLAALEPVETLTHEESRMRRSELATDHPGRDATDNNYNNNINNNTHGVVRFEPRTDARRKELDHFAREVADRLDQGLAARKFESLAVCASNPFLGELRTRLSEPVQKKISLEFNADLTSLSPTEIERRLKEARP